MSIRVNRIFTCVLALVLMLAMTFAVDTAFASGDDEISVTDKSIYIPVGYKSSDCVLTSNAYMLRRAAIERGSLEWEDINNKTLRPIACTSKTGSSLKFQYTCEFDGITYTVMHGYLQGSAAERKKKIKALLDKHPEGIVVRGPSKSGGHGVLLTGYKGDTIYAVDSAQNIKGGNRGITTFGKTTMTNLGACSHYWYCETISGKAESTVSGAKITKLQPTRVDDLVILTWDNTCDSDVELKGYVVSVKKPGSDKFEKLATTKSETYVANDLEADKEYQFRIKGYKELNDHMVYTKSKTVTVFMSAADTDSDSTGEISEALDTSDMSDIENQNQ